jgi:hypothetical protein
MELKLALPTQPAKLPSRNTELMPLKLPWLSKISASEAGYLELLTPLNTMSPLLLKLLDHMLHGLPKKPGKVLKHVMLTQHAKPLSRNTELRLLRLP